MTTAYPLFRVPNQSSFLESFGIKPVEAMPHDGYWCYEITDQYDTTLQLSFNTHERSLQTTILLQGRKIETTSQEGATSLEIFEKNGEPALRGECYFDNAQSSVEIEVKPAILIKWSTLVTEICVLDALSEAPLPCLAHALKQGSKPSPYVDPDE